MELTAVMPDDIRHLTGDYVTLCLTDDTRLSGIMKGVNSKGVRIKPEDGKETTRSLRRISAVVTEDVEDTRTEDDFDVLKGDIESEDHTPEDGEMTSERDTTVVEETDLHVITLPTDAEMEAKAEAAYETVKAEMDDSERDMTVEATPIDLGVSVSTPAQLAAIFGTSAFNIRQHLRALGLACGQGKRYDLSTLTPENLGKIRAAVMSK